MKKSPLKRGKPLKKTSSQKKAIAKRKAWKELSLFIRNRDNWTCVTCGTYAQGADMHSGHYIHNRANTYWREDNIHAQCRKCNYFASGNLAEYAIFMLNKYGEGHLRQLTEDSKVLKQWTKKEYDEIALKYKKLNEVQD